ncbi:nucleoside deaminase [Clostridium sp. C2-6-12]|uniref:nucleoside deaminase n=1 Tax=Clostridium sp. C2-6-12 TaxID=2698832 RepID=UPI00136DAE53|nr:nucleoside deaminase [Clostridium sp. C2-6-12]
MKNNDFNKHEFYISKCHELAINAGKRGYDSFGALLVHKDTILEVAENTSNYARGLFGHAEFNVVQKCANKYSDEVLKNSILYTSCAPCTRCLMAILSLGITHIVYSVSYESFAKLLPFESKTPDYLNIFKQMDINLIMIGPILEDIGMHTFEYWGGNYRPLEELLLESENERNK